MILRQIPGHPQQPGSNVDNIFPCLPLFPEAEECFLGDVHGDIGVQPARIDKRPDFPAMAPVNGLKLRMARRL